MPPYTPATIYETEPQSFVIRDSRPEDFDQIHRLICELAENEKMPDAMKMSAEKLRSDAFGEGHPPRFFALVIELLGTNEIVGYSIYHERYSTWSGRTLWIEDLYVSREYRGNGIGGAIFKHLSKRAARDNLVRIEWTVHSWNNAAIRFYKKMGGFDLTETEQWHTYRLNKEQYQKLLTKD